MIDQRPKAEGRGVHVPATSSRSGVAERERGAAQLGARVLVPRSSFRVHERAVARQDCLRATRRRDAAPAQAPRRRQMGGHAGEEARALGDLAGDARPGRAQPQSVTARVEHVEREHVARATGRSSSAAAATTPSPRSSNGANPTKLDVKFLYAGYKNEPGKNAYLATSAQATYQKPRSGPSRGGGGRPCSVAGIGLRLPLEMRRGHVVLALPLLLSIPACGEKAPPAKSAAVEKLPPPPPPAPPPVVQRTPSKEMAAHFPFKDEEITTLAYSDLGLLSQPEAVSSLAAGLAPVASELGGVDKACVDAIVGGAKELLIAGTTGQAWVAILKIPGHTLDTLCAPDAKTGESETIDGATKAWRFAESGKTCAVAPDWLLCGAPELVKRSLAAQNEPTLPVGLEPEQILALDDRDAVKDVKVTAASYPDRLETRIELNYDSDESPRLLHELLSHAPENAPAFANEMNATDEQRRLIELLGNSVVASHRAQRAHIRVDVAGKPSEQATHLGTFMSLLGKVAIAERQEHRKKAVKDQLQAIADGIAKGWETKDPKSPFAGKKCTSMPPVPKEIPRGQRVTTAEAGWKGWREVPIVTTPSFYQYEIKAAPDGQTCDVLGRGDLNGDGKPSTFKLHIRVDKSSKQLMIEPKIEETDPDE